MLFQLMKFHLIKSNQKPIKTVTTNSMRLRSEVKLLTPLQTTKKRCCKVSLTFCTSKERNRKMKRSLKTPSLIGQLRKLILTEERTYLELLLKNSLKHVLTLIKNKPSSTWSYSNSPLVANSSLELTLTLLWKLIKILDADALQKLSSKSLACSLVLSCLKLSIRLKRTQKLLPSPLRYYLNSSQLTL